MDEQDEEEQGMISLLRWGGELENPSAFLRLQRELVAASPNFTGRVPRSAAFFLLEEPCVEEKKRQR